ncbi:S8 family serine peptidase [Carboxylicivirga sp. A043]|uniref:S8 family serine peptidase n=1 Tax=Carboxylicivirga litoralis TaxID=2816963 RepID=UPI0021CB8195|nr:S8 family serine peptidase [Carboxylicivirga sp. A043]MCU4155394.1 S8 family serine peptidase [Carboxylicivirga sp. A043]
MKQLIAISLLLISFTISKAQNGYWVSFTDKKDSPNSVEQPQAFLSQRAIERRQKQNIAISEEDFPVNASYVDSLKNAGIDVRHTSKWLNGAIVFSAHTELMDTLARVSFIASVEKTKQVTSAKTFEKFEAIAPSLKSQGESDYGQAWNQISTVNGHKLHQNSFTGEGMIIAVIDAGFYKADELPLFQHLWDNNQILGTKDFVDPHSNIFAEHRHGMNVLSIIGGKMSQQFIGTAPDASFWLLRSEDADSEYPIEPDYWVCAAEFADSAGVDIINTSLGYYEFDSPAMSYTYDDLNASSRASRASDIASSKGMIVITSAGNEGNDSWRYIGVPADAKECLAIGAMTSDSVKAGFSSFGLENGPIKPEVTAMGVSVAVQNTSGSISTGNGTSFSAPVITGLAACLWQALPEKSASEIRQLIIDSAHQSDNPDNELGYGIPDFNLAYHVDVPELTRDEQQWSIAPNPFKQQLILSNQAYKNVTVSLIDLTGRLRFKKQYINEKRIVINEVAHLPNGIYIVSIENKHFRQHVKVIKSR